MIFKELPIESFRRPVRLTFYEDIQKDQRDDLTSW